MITVYTKDNCPACLFLKAKLNAQNKDFREVKIGRDISVDDFFEKYPGVKTVPYMVEEDGPGLIPKDPT